MIGFWHLRCLNDHIDLLYMIGSFASGTNVSLVAKNGTKTIIPLLWIRSSKKPQIKKFHKTDPPKVGILIQNTILKFSKSVTASLVVQNGTENHFSCLKSYRAPIWNLSLLPLNISMEPILEPFWDHFRSILGPF